MWENTSVDLPARVSDALSHPTRARLFAQLGELRRPAATRELAALLGLHHNGVRLHLERMREAGLVARERERRGRGRPRAMWTIAPGARPSGEPPRAYADLGRWLVRLIKAERRTLAAVEAEGRAIGHELAPADGGSEPEQTMYATLASLGFEPERQPAERGLTYRLCNCPYRDAVAENQDVVCTLHRGITRGLLDGIEPETDLAGFVPRDPYAAGCLIELENGLAQAAR